MAWSIFCSTFEDVMPCSLADGQKSFRRTCFASSNIRYKPTFFNKDISKTLINIYQVKRCHVPVSSYLQRYRRQNFKVNIMFIYLFNGTVSNSWNGGRTMKNEGKGKKTSYLIFGTILVFTFKGRD